MISWTASAVEGRREGETGGEVIEEEDEEGSEDEEDDSDAPEGRSGG